jgi:hypothetical protein
MELQDHHIEDFIDLYQKRYGVVLEANEAHKKALQLCKLIELVAFTPKTANEYGRINS